MTTGPDLPPTPPQEGPGASGAAAPQPSYSPPGAAFPPPAAAFPPPGVNGAPAPGAGVPGPGGATAVPGSPAPTKKSPRKWVAGVVTLVAVVLAGGRVFGLFGTGDPDVGDCVQMKGETSFSVVDCNSSKAQYKIVGVEKTKQTYGDFQKDDSVCSGFPSAEAALWTGEQTEKGTVYCAAPA